MFFIRIRFLIYFLVINFSTNRVAGRVRNSDINTSPYYNATFYAVNRVNTGERAMIEFPIIPWPVNENLLSYLKKEVPWGLMYWIPRHFTKACTRIISKLF